MGGQLKHIRTVCTSIEIWLPLVGWTVVFESTRVECGPGGTDCPIQNPRV